MCFLLRGVLSSLTSLTSFTLDLTSFTLDCSSMSLAPNLAFLGKKEREDHMLVPVVIPS